MPSLDWIGKKVVTNYHKVVPFHLLKADKEHSAGNPDCPNILLHADNLKGLKALLPYYAGQVQCIYIDPPYNTGKENWVYNDNVNSPEIREWLGNVVGKEAEDLSRHDKWLCMMYPRLKLARKFLSEDGAIFISIDDIELANLRCLMDEIFGYRNILSCFIWQTEGNFDNQAKVKISHEYVLAYAKNIDQFPAPPVIDPNIPATSKLYKEEIRNTIVKNGPKNPISGITIPIGFPADFDDGIISSRTDAWPHYNKDLIVKNRRTTNEVIVESGWSSKKILEQFIESGFRPVLDTKSQESVFTITSTGAIEAVKKRKSDQSHVTSVLREMGSTQSTSAALKEIGIKFDYPKPTKLLKYLISMISNPNCTILDFFAGSGTTADAVLELNDETQSNRRFILIEIEAHIAKNICAKRLISKISRINDSAKHNMGFTFCELGTPLFNEVGAINQSVKFSDLARYVYFYETGTPLIDKQKSTTPLLGIHNGKAVYLLYNGILGDKSLQGGNTLTRHVFELLPKHNGPKVIYGTSCRIGEDRLSKNDITFRQIPYSIKVD